jgi:sodium transport system permease protein
MNWRQLSVIVRKELTDHRRDRRALLSASFGVFFGPLIIAVMLTQIAKDQIAAEDISIPVSGAAHAPTLVTWLEQQAGVTVVEAPEDAEAAVRAGTLDLAVVIDEDFQKDFSESKPAQVKLIYDGSENKLQATIRRARLLLNGYSSTMGALRLMARGVSPAAAQPLDLQEVEVSSAQQRAARILGILPMMILLSAFGASMGAAADATAGERERGSLEALLMNPVDLPTIVGGKWLAAAAFSVLGSLASLLLCAYAMQAIPLQDLGIRFQLEPWQLALGALIVLPAALFAPALQMLVCSFSKTLKEAQPYLGLLTMAAMAPGMIAAIYGVENADWMLAAPFFSQTKLLSSVLAGERPEAWELAFSAALSLAATAVCLYAISRLMRSEKLVINR